MSFDTVLYFAASLAEITIVGLLLYRRLWRTFPFFLAYNIWTPVASAAQFVILRQYSTSSPQYVSAYLANLIVDSTLMFAVLIELAWSVLRPLRPSLSRVAILALGVLILFAGAAIWPFSSIPGISRLSPELAMLLRLKQTFSLLSVLIFLLLAGFSQLLSLGWRNRELQIATGLGFYSLVGVVVTVLHTYSSMQAQYLLLERLLVVSGVCLFLYWIYSFSQKEQERREFSPQMQSLLLAVAGAAHANRVALTERREKSPRS